MSNEQKQSVSDLAAAIEKLKAEEPAKYLEFLKFINTGIEVVTTELENAARGAK